MYIRPEQIAEQYEMEVKSISKGRDCFLCETDLGMRALKEYRGSVERAEFLAGMLDFLKEQNIVAEQIFYTKEGEIFARDEEEQNYLLLSVFRGAECDTKSMEDMVYAVRLLAGLHNATEQYPDEVPEFVKMNPNALLLLYENITVNCGRCAIISVAENRKMSLKKCSCASLQVFLKRHRLSQSSCKIWRFVRS